MPETTASPICALVQPSPSCPSCAVLVMSCDSYQDLWTPFFTLFWRYWPDCPFPVYLGTNSAQFEDCRISNLPAGDLPWGQCLRLNLAEINADYVLLLLDDYFFTEPVRTNDIIAASCTLDQLDGMVLRLFPLPGPDKPVEGFSSIGQIDRFASYRVSTQAAIWNRSKLLKLVRDDETVWDFERAGSDRSRLVADRFYSSYESVLPYEHVVERGVWFRSAAAYFAKQQIGCDFSARCIMSAATAARKAIIRRGKNALDHILPPRLRFRI